jgi:flagellar biosynthesis/type III secretory pathway chaperone
MNQNDAQWIEQQVEKKKRLYQNLRTCFEKERQALIQVEIDGLWRISSEKDTLCMEISTVKKELADFVASSCPAPFDLNQLHTMLPQKNCAAVNRSVQEIMVLKKEIDMLRQCNMTYMNESLQFMDQIMSMISGGGKKNTPTVYNRQCALNSQKPTRFLRQEV